MTINNRNDFASLLSELPKLVSGIVHFGIFMNLVSTLNRGCKCNRKKLKEQIEQSYKTVLLKKKDDELFRREIKQFLLSSEEKSITFYHEEKEIFSLSL